MKKTKTINLEQLRELGACPKGLDQFQAIFGDADVEVTVENCMKVNYAYVYWLTKMIGDAKSMENYISALYAAEAAYKNTADIVAASDTYGVMVAEAFIAVWKKYEKD